jgi:hypothetical protein
MKRKINLYVIVMSLLVSTIALASCNKPINKERPMSKSLKRGAGSALVLCVASVTANCYADDYHAKNDFGKKVEHLLKKQSNRLLGIKKPLGQSAAATSGAYRSVSQKATDQVLVAKGLKVEYLTRTAGNKTDMMAFWPTETSPTHIISCVEGSRSEIEPGKYNPSVQRINLKTGVVETVLRGMSRCDGIRLTPWGTILATEEASDGGAYEILNPLAITDESVTDRTTGAVTAPAMVVKRTALPTMSWEGLTVLPSGVVIGGDELRPGSNGLADSDGGAIFKFVPATARTTSGNIADLAQSPLVNGSVYAMRIACTTPTGQYGQGCEVGNGSWVSVNAATARTDANANGATGYYRPEDLHRDPLYKGDGVRFCWANTGNEGASHFGEVMCAIDRKPVDPASVVIANRFVEGDRDFNSFDNLAFQPVSGNLFVIEDHPNGDIFACLRDGKDRDIKTDGCVKILSVKDSSAEPSGFMFSADGKTAFVSIQHSRDDNMPTVDGYATDDVLKITGFKLPVPRH